MRRRVSLLCAPILFLAIVCAVAGTFGGTVLAHEAARWSGEPRVVLVHPMARGKWTATTIQDGIDMVAPGGWVFVFPATYAEVLNVTKGVTIDGIGGNIWPVIVAPPGTPASVIEIATTDPVTLRGLTVHVPGTERHPWRRRSGSDRGAIHGSRRESAGRCREHLDCREQ